MKDELPNRGDGKPDRWWRSDLGDPVVGNYDPPRKCGVCGKDIFSEPNQHWVFDHICKDCYVQEKNK